MGPDVILDCVPLQTRKDFCQKDTNKPMSYGLAFLLFPAFCYFFHTRSDRACARMFLGAGVTSRSKFRCHLDTASWGQSESPLPQCRVNVVMKVILDKKQNQGVISPCISAHVIGVTSAPRVPTDRLNRGELDIRVSQSLDAVSSLSFSSHWKWRDSPPGSERSSVESNDRLGVHALNFA